MKIAILSIGNELLSGDTINTNAGWMGSKLTDIGCNICRQITVPDKIDSISNALTELVNLNPDYIICTGGLGPTDDDITRQTLFDFVGTESKFDQNYWESLCVRFNRFGIQIPKSNRNQALVPLDGEVVPNPVGSARGSKLQVNDTILISLPGVPAEMKAMMTDSIIPMIQENELNPKCIRTLRTTGIPESALIEKISPVLEKEQACDIGYYPSLFGVDVRISHTDSQTVDLLSKDLYKILDFSIYAEGKDSIEDVVIQLAKSKNITVSTAESCTGGLIGHRLTEVSGSSDVYKGGFVVYSNESKIDLLGVEKSILKKYGAVSEETAQSMAKNVTKIFNSDFGISVTGIAGPVGGTDHKPVGLVYIGLAKKDSVNVKEFHFGTHRKRNKLRTSQAALNWLRLSLLND
ncbi:MAG: CinA family nicotinamide mononucleotide deamidase-related protein [Candidatus Marinimicrobia bacterium]|nr:CinA family nicotinamide mononucleotide deamidase-related protein [Candidatus Neomarinimicrobiota bacterium]